MLICADPEFVLSPSTGHCFISNALCTFCKSWQSCWEAVSAFVFSSLFSNLPLQNPFRIHNFLIISFYLSLAFYYWHYALTPIVNLTLWDKIKRWQSVTLCACMWACVCIWILDMWRKDKEDIAEYLLWIRNLTIINYITRPSPQSVYLNSIKPQDTGSFFFLVWSWFIYFYLLIYGIENPHFFYSSHLYFKIFN